MIVRPARREDVTALAALHVDTWRAAYRGIMPDALLDGLSYDPFQEHWAAHLSNPTRTSLVAEFTDQVIGFAALGPCRDADVDAVTVGDLYGIYVHADHWDRRAGWMLWSAAADVLADRGFGEAALWVLEANAMARRFYERAGLPEPAAHRWVEREGASIPEVRYRLRLGGTGAYPRHPDHDTRGHTVDRGERR